MCNVEIVFGICGFKTFNFFFIHEKMTKWQKWLTLKDVHVDLDLFFRWKLPLVFKPSWMHSCQLTKEMYIYIFMVIVAFVLVQVFFPILCLQWPVNNPWTLTIAIIFFFEKRYSYLLINGGDQQIPHISNRHYFSWEMA